MYFPYLRGRQFELIALREFAIQRGDNNNIIPIIEPVKKSLNSLKLAFPKLIEGDVKFSLILNPQVGDMKGKKHILKDLDEILKNELKDRKTWIPTFIISDNAEKISEIIEKKGLKRVMLILSDTVDIEDFDVDILLLSPKVKYILFKENRSLKRKLSNTDKKLIRLDDNFKGQKRNSDYLDMPEEKLTEEHIYYRDENFYGFSDYTILESDFTEGGSTPRAVAIHLSYKKPNKVIWLKHFTSVSNYGISNVQGKFAEAAKKAVKFLDSEGINTYAADELRKYYSDKKYPGLGMVKKISIKNHLELINGILLPTV